MPPEMQREMPPPPRQQVQQQAQDEVPHHRRTEEFGADRLEARHGRVDRWLQLVYLVMFIWALYYGYVYWGGLGPGLDLGQ